MSIEKKILPETKFIWEFLQLESNNKFVIPAYQREYSWTYKVQCEKLWQDIEEYDNSDSNDPYFFGTIIEDCSPEHNNELYLIDGQQRTTTFLLILKALQLKLNEVLKNFKLTGSNQGQYDDLKIFRTQTIELLFKFMRDGQRTEQIINNWDEHKNEICILENRSNNEEHKDELETILRSRSFDEAEKNCYKNPKRKLDNRFTNYFKNFRFFYRDKIDILNESQVNSIAKTFLTKCQVIVIKTWRVDQAITMFNSLNSTGMPLSDSNILSAQLYESARKLNLNSFDDLWREIIRASSTLETEGICDINSILQQYMYIYRALNKEYLKDSNTIDITTPGVRRYYMEINKNLSNDPEHLCKEFLKILNIWDKIKEYDITKLILKFNENVKLFLISYLYRFAPEDINEQLVEDFSKYLIRLFAVMEIVETGYSSKHFKSFLFAENIKIVDKKISLTELEDDFDKHIKSTWDK